MLVNNAGLGHYAFFPDQDLEVVRRIFEINVVALCDLTQRAARHMKSRGNGQILEISSVLGFVGMPYSTAYVASKHAVNGIVKSLRYELRGTGVRVWAACPARTLSEFNEVALADPTSTGRLPHGEPTEKVVRGIVRGIDRRSRFLLPTWNAWAIVTCAAWFPPIFEWAMDRWSAGHFGRELEQARAGGGTR